MNFQKSAYWLLCLIVALILSACGENPLLGKWEAQQPKDLMLPLSATAMGKLEFQEGHLLIADEIIRCRYDVEDDQVTVAVERGPGPGEVFVMKGRTRMIRNIPSIGPVVYKKID